jgi:TRAP-type C4-dicarboxylate transport system permease small subunit
LGTDARRERWGRSALARAWRTFVVGQQVLAAALLVFVVGVTLVNVAMRYAVSRPIVWADEAARLGFVCFAFLGAALGVATHAHLAIDTLVERLPDRGARVVRGAATVVAVGFFAVLVVGGWSQVGRNMGQASPALRVPLGYIYAAIPVGGVLALVNLLGVHLFSPAELPEPGRDAPWIDGREPA